MKPEEKNGLGRVLRKRLKALNYTQERLAGAAGINLRTVQRALGGQGISKENLSAIASALGLDEQEILKQAASVGPPSPEKRLTLKQIKSAPDFIKVMEGAINSGQSQEICPAGEDRFNEFIGEEIVALASDIGHGISTKNGKLAAREEAQRILATCRGMGFGLFAGCYTETIKQTKAAKRKKTILMIVAAALADPRTRKGLKGLELDVVRDSRRLLYSQLMSGPTGYDWVEDQLMGKTGREEVVKAALRGIMAQARNDGKQQTKRRKK